MSRPADHRSEQPQNSNGRDFVKQILRIFPRRSQRPACGPAHRADGACRSADAKRDLPAAYDAHARRPPYSNVRKYVSHIRLQSELVSMGSRHTRSIQRFDHAAAVEK
jgi:hypothetical protein